MACGFNCGFKARNRISVPAGRLKLAPARGGAIVFPSWNIVSHPSGAGVVRRTATAVETAGYGHSSLRDWHNGGVPRLNGVTGQVATGAPASGTARWRSSCSLSPIPCPSANPRFETSRVGNRRSNPPIHQSINPSIHQSINPPIHQSINPSIHQSINPSIHQSINPPTRATPPSRAGGRRSAKFLIPACRCGRTAPSFPRCLNDWIRR